MKRTSPLIPLLLALSLLVSLCLPALAAVSGDAAGMQQEGWPWQVCDAFEAAIQSGDDASAIASGTTILAMFLGDKDPTLLAQQYVDGNDTAQINTVWNTLWKLIPVYERVGDRQALVQILTAAMPFAKAYQQTLAADPGDMEFAMQELANKQFIFSSHLAVYTRTEGVADGRFYLGARHEPRGGLYFGEVDDHSADSAKRASGALIYVEYETEEMQERVEFSERAYRSVSGRDIVEIAWNLRQEGATLASIVNDADKITRAARYLAGLGTNVLLRFGAEMNNWETFAQPDVYRQAFAFVADIMHQEAPNVAMVWSVLTGNREGVTYSDFYPGDQYVDWVGVSLYTMKYFHGDPNQSDLVQSLYGTGKYANPLLWIDKLVTLYGDTKPILVTEGGVQNFNGPNGEDLSAWADPYMRILYTYIPMVYPQVKGIFYFNTEVNEPHRYALTPSPALSRLYGELTQSGSFLAYGQGQGSVSHQQLSGAVLSASNVSLATYAPYFTMDNVAVRYQLEGEAPRTMRVIPYSVSYDLGGLADGTRQLTVTATSGEQVLDSDVFYLTKAGTRVTVSTAAPAPAQQPSELVATPTTSPVLLDGQPTVFDAYLIDGNNYFKLRDLALAIADSSKRFAVDWDGKANAIALTSGGTYIPDGSEMKAGGSGPRTPIPTTATITQDGLPIAPEGYTIEGNNYFKLRNIGQAFDFDVTWDNTNGVIVIDTSIGYTPD